MSINTHKKNVEFMITIEKPQDVRMIDGWEMYNVNNEPYMSARYAAMKLGYGDTNAVLVIYPCF